ncbi:hypothetical protein [Hyphomicrobium sp. D-2]|uniref:hypothetical protein n=1 Tax=Hyphomicrobium sp. D-2 TaxID=3041621 RepID=UPI002458B7E2|nr:hypothetical protein [Hyphomicrobium sp. D-2]MDH4982369.1 hypothetical protein [Hyphomicrobium sp. D-2]
MAFARTYICALGALSLLALTASNAAAGAWTVAASSAHPATTLTVVSTVDAGRKGTRNYREGGSTDTAAPSISDYKAPTRAEKLQYCIDTWDAGTHITKSKWREICKRQLAAGE